MDVLFSRGDEKESDNDVWDDSELQAAYDKAMQMAKKHVDRHAPKTSSVPKKNERVPRSSKDMGQSSVKLKLGIECRAVYEDDLETYEAIITKILDDDHCVVRFIGYDNEQVCKLKELKPSLGPEERLRQVEESMAEVKLEEKPQKTSKSKKRTHRKKHKQQSPKMESYLNSITNISPGIPFAPPPPMLFRSDDSNSEESSMLYSMLLSWYMAGYNTGLREAHNRHSSRRRGDDNGHSDD